MTTEENLLSCLMLRESGADTLQLCRYAGVSASSFTEPNNPDLFSRIARALDEGKREHEISESILADTPELFPAVNLLTGPSKQPTSALASKFINEVRAAQIRIARDLTFARLTEAQRDSNANPDEIARLQSAFLSFDQQGDQSMTAGESATDLDASLRFAAANSQTLRYCPGIGWLYWDKRRWKHDDEGRAIELSKKCARDWLTQCNRYTGENRPDRIKAALAFESAAHLKAAVDLAKSDRHLVSPVETLDTDPWKLNVLNGTIDLRTGKLHPHDRADLITKLAPVLYDPDAQHDTLDRYLATIEQNTKEMAAFLARCFGVGLTGDASPESLFLLQGDAGSGKTTLVEAMSAIMGDYAVKLQFESFCQSKNGRGAGSASPDLIPLRGSRLAYASEGDQSARLDAGVVKALTGNEPITARGLYSSPITFSQTWKLWLVSNYDPKASSDDTGIWRRMLKLHFEVIPEKQRDHLVKRTLTTDKKAHCALLAWAVRGCKDWQERGGGRIGLAPPECVNSATEDYRIKQDTLSEWWDDLLSESAELVPNAWTPVRDLRHHYEDWCRDNGAMSVQIKRFNDYAEKKGLVSKRGSGGARGWSGIKMSHSETLTTNSGTNETTASDTSDGSPKTFYTHTRKESLGKGVTPVTNSQKSEVDSPVSEASLPGLEPPAAPEKPWTYHHMISSGPEQQF
uniref:DNA primase family protein n=1 Tax=Cephaloticoccus sp. TaxID=1985742 RepID=UPI00404B44E6